jgi:hypothetical protein
LDDEVVTEAPSKIHSHDVGLPILLSVKSIQVPVHIESCDPENDALNAEAPFEVCPEIALPQRSSQSGAPSHIRAIEQPLLPPPGNNVKDVVGELTDMV